MKDILHPMLRRERPVIDTMPSVHLAVAVANCLEYGRPSLSIYGDARVGKSTAVDILRSTTKWRPFPLGFLRFVCGDPKDHTEAYLIRQIASGMRLTFPVRALTQDITRRIVLAIEEEAARSDSTVVVIIVESAEQLSLEDYNHLAKVQNEFQGNPVQPFFLFIHQSDHKSEGLDKPVKLAPPHTYGRFFVDSYRFTGLRWAYSKADKSLQDGSDVALAFRQFDSVLRWPDSQGPTYTEEFAPNIFTSGGLEKRTAMIEKEMQGVCAAAQIAMPVDWQMSSFNGFIFSLFKEFVGAPNCSELTSEMIRTALQRSAFVGFERARQRKRL
ncbi:hypothetical protein [Stenotrophomonas sp.]|uniref:hypothetical protein n=1 Tax=Stenotrophomonas sp. TaxID=69392 RepID=UPI0028AFDAE1|nr:hypothetical protein [Stenotrophomonas sp.]